MLRDYPLEKKSTDFENFDAHELNEVLFHFNMYVDLRKTNGEMCKSSSLENVMYRSKISTISKNI